MKIKKTTICKILTPQVSCCVGGTSGFTLVETLVGLFIFLLAYVALSQVSAGALQDISITSRKLTAQYLAEEGVEYVKYVQKSYPSGSTAKSTFLSDINTATTGGCTSFLPVTVGCDFFYDPATQAVGYKKFTSNLNLYQYGLLSSVFATYSNSTYTASPYTRKIYIDDITVNPVSHPNEAVKVTSEVYYPLSPTPVVVTAVLHFSL